MVVSIGEGLPQELNNSRNPKQQASKKTCLLRLGIIENRILMDAAKLYNLETSFYMLNVKFFIGRREC